jgi:hypothetical protein
MHKFSDQGGQEWEVAVTIGAIKRVKAELPGVDLLNPGDGDPPLLMRLAREDELLCAVLFAICKPQADSRNVTDLQFAEAMGGSALSAGEEALSAELTDFFRTRGDTIRFEQIRQAAAINQKLRDAAREMADQTASHLQTVNVKEVVSRIAGKQFTDLQERLASIQPPSPSGN